MQREFMDRAIELSRIRMRTGRGGPFGAVIVKGERIIAEGYNEVIARSDPTAHAEIVAIRKAGSRLHDFHMPGCEIYVSCEPCPMCLAAIYWARIEKIYFANTAEDAAKIGFDDGFFYREIQDAEDRAESRPIRSCGTQRCRSFGNGTIWTTAIRNFRDFQPRQLVYENESGGSARRSLFCYLLPIRRPRRVLRPRCRSRPG